MENKEREWSRRRGCDKHVLANHVEYAKLVLAIT